ncbi:probable methyltransferase TARBP1 isoform X3 [Heterodontus francisci]|uniref:probable methyltransferase TARBP1 isoform X3 n=1 Tax=Heterodontus francisci TaxID=7792 RepID=UPI00355B8C07
MEPLLVADLLLRFGRGPHSGSFLRELCRWCREGEGQPGADRVETLRLLVESSGPGYPGSVGEQASDLGDCEWRGPTAEQEDLLSSLRDVAVGWCLPMLRGMRLEGPGGQFQEPGRRLVHSLCALLHACCRQAPPALLQDVVCSSLQDLRSYTEERCRVGSAGGKEAESCNSQVPEYSDIHVAIEVLVKVAPLLLERGIGTEELLSLVLTTVKLGEDSVASRMVTGVIPALLLNPGSSEQKCPTVKDVWDRVKRWERTSTVSRVLLLLSSLPHQLLLCTGDRSPPETFDLRTCPEFWEVVQMGLVQPNSTSRKRAMYLLKRAVDVSNTLKSQICLQYQAGCDSCLFWWSGENSTQLVQLWENYILIMETLEENQVHVIRPILPRLKSLMDATVFNDQGHSLFHTSWLLCAYKRMFESENKTVMKEGLFQFLDLGVMKYPFRTQKLSEFICGPVMDVLSESTFYSRSPDQLIGSCPILGVKLQTFFVDFVENVAEEFKGDFLMKLVKSMATKHWSAIPILFISRALVHIPSRKTWGAEGLHALREVLCCTMTNHQVLLRGAAQCCLLQTAMNLTNVENVTLSDIANFLASIRTDEALCRGTKLWVEVCEWLHSNDRNFRLEEGVAEMHLKRSALSIYIRNLVEQYMRVPATEGEKASYMPDGFEAQLVARIILLSADIEERYSTEGVFDGGNQKALACFLHPLLDVLWKLNTHAYLPVLKADKSLQLLLELLEMSAPKHHITKSEDRVLNVLRECVMSSVEQVLEYTLRRLTSELQTVLDLDRCSLYLAVMSEIVKTFSSSPPLRGSCIWNYISCLTQASIQHLQVSNDNEITDRLLEISQTKTGVFNVLITHCCQTWLPAVYTAKSFHQDSFTSAENHVDLFVEACLFGPVFRKDQRLIQDVHIYIELLGDECAANRATECENRDDQSVRIWAINFLCQLNGSNSLHKKFMENVVSKLLEKDEELRNTKGRYYVNSMLHRLKNRIWQTLLVLFPQMDQIFLSSIIETVYQSGLSDNQASVKYFIEWFITLILQKYPEFIDSFWRCFSYNPENTKTSICTFLAVLVHIKVILKNISKKDQYFKKALSVILPWCLNHNFSVRLYALLALQEVWNACLQSKLEGKELQFLAPVIESCLEQVGHKQTTGNAGRNWQRIQDHFFFGKFQPLEDYSLETIFYIFPRLSDVIEDEWIPAWKFNRVMDLFPSSSSINLFNPRNQLYDVKLANWIQRDKGCGLAEVDQDAEWADVQKKIMPWKNNIPDQDLELIYQERTTKYGKSSNSSLIIVASLIDKPTNLGGLCRTSEIFGASALVVNNVHCVNDKQFQALSVSAEQWLPVIEVRPAQLVEYLQQKKTEGHTIIGVEQTANSHNLAQYSFPEKTLLLLGNEREGIPANLIQHLDVCVEIPQCGIIRSLNVHVSGALLMWEYLRQQMMKQGVRP